MSMNWRVLRRIAVLAIYVTLGWLAGLAVLAAFVVRNVRRFRRLRRALAPTIACPWCRVDVAQYGPYGCTQCRARTLGWAWRCSACGAWAGHIACTGCSLSVSNPLLGAP
jgi:hypothetical protein